MCICFSILEWTYGIKSFYLDVLAKYNVKWKAKIHFLNEWWVSNTKTGVIVSLISDGQEYIKPLSFYTLQQSF